MSLGRYRPASRTDTTRKSLGGVTRSLSRSHGGCQTCRYRAKRECYMGECRKQCCSSERGLAAFMAMEGLNAGAGKEALDMTRWAELVSLISDRLHRRLSINSLSVSTRHPAEIPLCPLAFVRITVGQRQDFNCLVLESREIRPPQPGYNLTGHSLTERCIDPRNGEILDSREICASNHISPRSQQWYCRNCGIGGSHPRSAICPGCRRCPGAAELSGGATPANSAIFRTDTPWNLFRAKATVARFCRHLGWRGITNLALP